jgi:hypothetical protein
MKTQIFCWSLVLALAEFLFGFDAVGVSGMEKTTQSRCGLGIWMPGISRRQRSIGRSGFSLGDWADESIWTQTNAAMAPETKRVSLEQVAGRLERGWS